jgi:predicted Zn-dependent protease with MMP-like domain
MRSQRFALLTTCAVTVLLTGAGSFLLYGFSSSTLVRVLQAVAIFGLGIAIIGGTVIAVIVRLGNWQEDEAAFEQTVDRSERLAARGLSGEGDDDFEPEFEEADFDDELQAAIHQLPSESHLALEYVEIVVVDYEDELESGRGRSVRLSEYGRYETGAGGDDQFSDRVVLFRETLLRDFGHNEMLLRERIAQTLRRGLAHRLGSGRGRILRRRN